MYRKLIHWILVTVVFVFPLLYMRGFVFPGVFPHTAFFFLATELLGLFALWHFIKNGEIKYKKSYITLGLVVYIVILFLTALLGIDFLQSFWSGFTRMTGIITWLHAALFFFVLSVFINGEHEWRHVFRALLFSGVALALVSYLGVDGSGVPLFSAIKEGGSLFGNTSYSGAYYVLVFLISAIGLFIESKRVWKGGYLAGLVFIFFNPDLFNFSILSGALPLAEAFKSPKEFMGMARASSLVLWTGVIVFTVLRLLHTIKNKKLVSWLFTGALLLGIVFIGIGVAQIKKGEGMLHDAYIIASGPARLIVWDSAIEGWYNRILFGYGVENFSYVYQANLDPALLRVEDPPWFDKVHNGTLEELTEKGIVGLCALLVLFILVTYRSVRLYIREKKLYFLFIPTILLLHFLQLQTFFQTEGTLVLVFLLIAFLVSHEPDRARDVRFVQKPFFANCVVLALAIICVCFFVVRPVKENRIIYLISKTEERETRLDLEENLEDLRVNPREALNLLGGQFIDNTASRVDTFLEFGLTDNVAKEYEMYLRAYDAHLLRYKDSYRYYLDYAHMINASFLFGVDRLAYGEELLNRALTLSDVYPHPYRLLAINLYYQGRIEEALEQAQIAYEIDPTIATSRELYEYLQKITGGAKTISETLPYLSGIK